MPEYRATVGFNAWLLRNHRFSATDDQAAISMQPKLDEWAHKVLIETSHHDGADLSSFPDAIILVDRLDGKGELEEEILRFDHSASHPLSDDLLRFAQNIARLTLFAESDYVSGRPDGTDPEAVQKDGDWLQAQDETLESLIQEARVLTTAQSHPPPSSSTG